MAILFSTDGFYLKNEYGISLLTFSTFSHYLPILTFLLSLLAASFGTSKFFLGGPVQFLPKNGSLDGLLSFPFISLCLLNTMFGVRTICLECALFTSYSYQNYQTWHDNSKQIDPIISPEFRLPIYFAPCVISFLVNAMRLWWTTRGLGKYFMKYPQFLLAPCFTPFLFEGCRANNSHGFCKIQVWKRGTICNAVYIGILPQFTLLLMDYFKGVVSWEFLGNKLWLEEKKSIFEVNDALFKHPYGNTIFAILTGALYMILITLFFSNKFIHCIYYSDPFLDISNSKISGSTKAIEQRSKICEDSEINFKKHNSNAKESTKNLGKSNLSNQDEQIKDLQLQVSTKLN